MLKTVLNDTPKRACIYFIYDKDGIIDDYIIYQLKDLRKNVSFLHCVINGKLAPDGRERLETLADDVYERENKGNDVGAYKAAIKYIGWEKLTEYDELVLMNNTCFGPIYPFKEVFDWAATKKNDFFGLTRETKPEWLTNNDYIHGNDCLTYYQSYFLVVRKHLFGSRLFREFFDEIPDDVNYTMSAYFYEFAFPGYFEDKGYRGAVYCDCEDVNYPLLHDPVSLFKNYRMPLFKKRSFFHNYTDVLHNTAGEATYKLMRFLSEETDYDQSMIWQTLLRTSSLSDLVRCAQLNRVLPRDMLVNKKKEGTMRVGVVYHAYYEDLFDEVTGYIKNFPADIGVLITTNTEEKKKLLEQKTNEIEHNCTIIVVQNHGRDVSALLVGAASFVFDYDLICFAHDKKSNQVIPHSAGRSWAYKLNENMFGSKEYVANVIDLFEQEKQLGIAFPPPPNHNAYADVVKDGWTGNFNNTQKLLKDFGVNTKINEHTLCVAPLGTCFWFRPVALKKLFAGYDGKGWSYQDFPCEPNRIDLTILHTIERAYAYFAQDAGFYPVYLYNDKYAQIELTNLEFNKTGSAEMRIWVNALTLDSIGYEKLEDIFNKPIDQITSQEIMSHYDNRNYGIKESLRHLARALRHRFPRSWALLLPVRRLGKKVLGVR